MGFLEDASSWVKQNQLKSIGGLWVGGLGASIAYQWSQDIPRSLKIIHSRVYAQALTLGALACLAVADNYDHKSTTADELHLQRQKLADIESKLDMQQAMEHQAGASAGSGVVRRHTHNP